MSEAVFYEIEVLRPLWRHHKLHEVGTRLVVPTEALPSIVDTQPPYGRVLRSTTDPPPPPPPAAEPSEEEGRPRRRRRDE